MLYEKYVPSICSFVICPVRRINNSESKFVSLAFLGIKSNSHASNLNVEFEGNSSICQSASNLPMVHIVLKIYERFQQNSREMSYESSFSRNLYSLLETDVPLFELEENFPQRCTQCESDEMSTKYLMACRAS